MPTAALPPQTLHLRGFIPDANDLYWKLLEEFYSLLPSHIDFGGSRVLAGSFASDETSLLTEWAGIKKSRDLRDKLYRPVTAMVAGMVYRETGIMPQMCSLNLYRNGKDFIEPQTDTDFFLGPDPENVVVASVSFGAPRIFKLERMDRTDECNVLLHPGDLFVMSGTLQREWLHSVPPCDAEAPRLSLNFIVPRKEEDETEERTTWLLTEVPESMRDLLLVPMKRRILARKLRNRTGPVPRPVYCGSLEEVFARWSAMEMDGNEQLVVVGPGQIASYESRENLLNEHRGRLEPLLQEGDPLRLVKDYMAAPDPDSIELARLPTDFLEDMSARIETELNKRADLLE